MTTKTRQLPHLEAAVAEESWHWLRDNAPIYADALQREVTTGATPDDIQYRIMQITQRPALALRLKQAAEYLRLGAQ